MHIYFTYHVQTILVQISFRMFPSQTIGGSRETKPERPKFERNKIQFECCVTRLRGLYNNYCYITNAYDLTAADTYDV